MTNIGPENYGWLGLAYDLRRERMGLDARDEYEAEQQAEADARHARIAADAVDAIVAVNDAAARAWEIERAMVEEHGASSERGGEQAAMSAESGRPFGLPRPESRLVGPIGNDGPPPRSLDALRPEHSPLTPSGGATVYPFRSKGIQ